MKMPLSLLRYSDSSSEAEYMKSIQSSSNYLHVYLKVQKLKSVQYATAIHNAIFRKLAMVWS